MSEPTLRSDHGIIWFSICIWQPGLNLVATKTKAHWQVHTQFYDEPGPIVDRFPLEMDAREVFGELLGRANSAMDFMALTGQKPTEEDSE